MDTFANIQRMCRVCLREPDECDDDQFVKLNQQQIEKLIYIGDSSEIIGLYREPLPLCQKCLIKLDFVYDFVEKFNLSKAKIKEYVGHYASDTYQITDLNPGESDTFVESDGDSTDKYAAIVKIETPPTPPPQYQPPYMTETPFQYDYSNMNINPVPRIGPPKSKMKNINAPHKIGPKSKTKKLHHLSSSTNSMSDDFRSQFHNRHSAEMSTSHHLFNQHQEEGSPSATHTTCHLCGKEFSTRANMLRHVREHEGRRFVCEYENCKAFFTQKSSLQVHLARHAGHKPFECEICGKRFSQSKSLVFHIRIHTGESPYECDYCQKTFKQKSNLIRHFKSHRNQAPIRQKRFKCEKCAKLLASKQSLIRHLNRHERMDDTILTMHRIDQNMLTMHRIDQNMIPIPRVGGNITAMQQQGMEDNKTTMHRTVDESMTTMPTTVVVVEDSKTAVHRIDESMTPVDRMDDNMIAMQAIKIEKNLLN